MAEKQDLQTKITEKERWWAALSYIFSPFLPAALIYIFDLQEMPFLKSHIYQALPMGILFCVTLPVILPATLCIGGLFWLIMPFWAIKAYAGQTISIPWVSDWIKNQSWY